MNQRISIALLSLAVCLSCERERKAETEAERTTTPGEQPAPQTAPPGAAPTATTATGEKTVGAKEEVALKGAREAEAKFTPLKGQKLSGEAELREVPKGVELTLEVKDGQPGSRSVHVYEKGDCSDVQKQSMGKHFAPKGAMMMSPTNLEVDKDGKGKLEVVIADANLKPNDPQSIVGKALVIETLTAAGAAPQQLACAVISSD